MNRDELARLIAMAKDQGVSMDIDGEEFDPAGPADDGNPFGTAEAEITWSVDVAPYLAQKRSAMAAHRSQVTDIGFFLEMPEEVFAMSFGTEWYIEPGVQATGPGRAGRSPEPRAHRVCRIRCPAVPRPSRPRRRGLGRRSRSAARRLGAAAGFAARGRARRSDPRWRAGGVEPAAPLPRTAAPLAARWGTQVRISVAWRRYRRQKECPWGSGCPGSGRPWPGAGPIWARAMSCTAATGWSASCSVAWRRRSWCPTSWPSTPPSAGRPGMTGCCSALDNCSITIVDVVDGRLHVVEGGHEADTLIR